MKRSLILAGVATVALLAATAAEAEGVSWSIGIHAPPVATYVSGGPDHPHRGFHRHHHSGYHHHAPRHYHVPHYRSVPIYVPAPVYYGPAPIGFAPPARIWHPLPRPWIGHGHHWHHRHGHPGHRGWHDKRRH
jgi:hypothetical protein